MHTLIDASGLFFFKRMDWPEYMTSVGCTRWLGRADRQIKISLIMNVRFGAKSPNLMPANVTAYTEYKLHGKLHGKEC